MLDISIDYPNLFTPNECNKIISLSLDKGIDPELILFGKKRIYKDPVLRKSLTTWILDSFPDEEINNKLKITITNTVKNIFKTEYYDKWIFQLSRYDIGDQLRWHIDDAYYDKTTGFRKFATIVQLTCPTQYSGGLVEIEARNPLSKEQGFATVMTTYKKHKVNEITKGSRYSLVVWLLGPAWK